MLTNTKASNVMYSKLLYMKSYKYSLKTPKIYCNYIVILYTTINIIKFNKLLMSVLINCYEFFMLHFVHVYCTCKSYKYSLKTPKIYCNYIVILYTTRNFIKFNQLLMSVLIMCYKFFMLHAICTYMYVYCIQ